MPSLVGDNRDDFQERNPLSEEDVMDEMTFHNILAHCDTRPRSFSRKMQGALPHHTTCINSCSTSKAFKCSYSCFIYDFCP